MTDPNLERIDDYLAEIDAQTAAWIEMDYQRRLAEHKRLAELWAKMQAKADAVNAEAEAIMQEMGW
jgi:hypothetical protein